MNIETYGLIRSHIIQCFIAQDTIGETVAYLRDMGYKVTEDFVDREMQSIMAEVFEAEEPSLEIEDREDYNFSSWEG
jgi:hypothetical protein